MTSAGANLKCDDRNVVLLTEALSGFGDGSSGSIADLLRPFKTETFTLRIRRLNHAIGNERQSVSGTQNECRAHGLAFRPYSTSLCIAAALYHTRGEPQVCRSREG